MPRPFVGPPGGWASIRVGYISPYGPHSKPYPTIREISYHLPTDGLDSTFRELLDRLFKQITVVPKTAVVREYETAAEATSPHPDADPERQFRDRDEGGVVFLATALAVEGDVWSDDTVFTHQDLAGWYRTEDVVSYSGIGLEDE